MANTTRDASTGDFKTIVFADGSTIASVGGVLTITPAGGGAVVAPGVSSVGGVTLASTGAAARKGVATLVLGETAAITTTAAVTGCRIMVTRNTPGGSTALGHLCVKDANLSTGVSFKITAVKNDNSATETGDVSTVNWEILG